MFLTLEDPRAKVQGSRDPLGALPIWAAFGRKLVTNLTTVSNSVRGFTIVLLARYYTERLIEDREVGEEALATRRARLQLSVGRGHRQTEEPIRAAVVVAELLE